MENVKQTGFLFKLEPTDFIAGASPLVTPEIMPSGDWRDFKPNEERQYKPFTFDTMSCTTFSALNTIETWVNYCIENDKFTVGQIETMNKLGFFADGKFNASDRFTAIMSGTMPQGNYFQNVWDSIRRDGLLPEAELPFDPTLKTWSEYHNKNVITQEMKDTAKKILEILEFSYEWCSLSLETSSLIAPALKQAPLQGAIPEQATHAIEILEKEWYFDTYPPFVKKLPAVRYSLKAFVSVKKPIILERSVEIVREKGSSKQTLGSLTAKNGQSVFTCKTLELPYLNNARNISCIPVGTYTCKYTFSPRFLKWTYEIKNVSGRSGIRIHSGNYYTDIDGCIILGNAFKDINRDNVLDVINSRITVNALEQFMGKKDFVLTIK